jgi:hypothetical protein
MIAATSTGGAGVRMPVGGAEEASASASARGVNWVAGECLLF